MALFAEVRKTLGLIHNHHPKQTPFSTPDNDETEPNKNKII